MKTNYEPYIITLVLVAYMALLSHFMFQYSKLLMGLFF